MDSKRFLLALSAMLIFVSDADAQRGRGMAPSADQNPPLAKTETVKRVLATIDAIVQSGALYANVPAADGRLLRLLTESTGAKTVVEIGTSTGISGLWFALALERTGGRLLTFELDAQRAEVARKHFKQAGMEKLITLTEGDAHANIQKIKETVDVVFIDAEKEGYVDYLNKMLPKVRPGGLILAHDTNMIPDYLKAIAANPDLDTVFYTQGGGMAVTLKKR